MIVLQFAVGEVVPSSPRGQSHCMRVEGKYDLRARVPIQQSSSLDELSPIPATFAFERLMRLAERILVEQEQLPERVEGEVAFHVLVLVDDRGREGLLIRLSLEDLLFDCASADEAVHKTWGRR